MRGAPKLLADQIAHLQDLLKTIKLVQRELVLQTPEIGELLLKVHRLAGELHTVLQAIASLQEKGLTRQFFHALGTGGQKVKHLREILDRLGQTRTDLSMRVQVVHVALSAAALPVISRIDDNIQNVLYYTRLPETEEDGFRKSSEITEQTVTSGLNKENDLSIERNSASDEADQLNAICGIGKSQRHIRGIIYKNVALGKSKQRNFIMDAASFEKFSVGQMR